MGIAYGPNFSVTSEHAAKFYDKITAENDWQPI